MKRKSHQQQSQWPVCSRSFFLIAVMLFVTSIPLAAGGRAHYVLVGQQQGITQVTSGQTKDVFFKSDRPHEAIEWAMSHSPITIVSAGTYTLSANISIPRPNVSLVITENPELVASATAERLILIYP